MSDFANEPVTVRPFLDQPEMCVAEFSFLLHFVWEFVQVPTYAGMAKMSHWGGTKICLSATIGDVGFALTAFWIVALVSHSRDWILNPTGLQISIFVATGISLTIGFEYYYTEITGRLAYSELMPLVPPFGTGLSPLLQWLLIPLLVIWFTKRQIGRTP